MHRSNGTEISSSMTQQCKMRQNPEYKRIHGVASWLAITAATSILVTAATTSATDVSYRFQSGCLKEKRVCTHRDKEGSPYCIRPPRYLQRPEIKLFVGNLFLHIEYVYLQLTLLTPRRKAIGIVQLSWRGWYK